MDCILAVSPAICGSGHINVSSNIVVFTCWHFQKVLQGSSVIDSACGLTLWPFAPLLCLSRKQDEDSQQQHNKSMGSKSVKAASEHDGVASSVEAGRIYNFLFKWTLHFLSASSEGASTLVQP